MRTTHKFTLKSMATIARGRAVSLTCAFVVMMALSFALTPASARQGMAQRISQSISPSRAAAKLLSYAPAPVRDAVGARLGMKSQSNRAAASTMASTLTPAAAFAGPTDVSLAMAVSVNGPGDAGGTNVFAGRARVIYNIDITNTGIGVGLSPIAAGELRITIPGLAPLVGDPNILFDAQGGFGAFGGAGTCTIGVLATTGCLNTAGFAVGQTRPFNFRLLVGSSNQAGKQLTVNPTVTYTGGTDVPGNNSATDTRIVANDGNLQITKDANPVSYPGGFITYTIAAQNAGAPWNPADFPATLPGAGNISTMYENRVTDVLPVEIGEIISVTSGAGWSCAPTSGLVNPPATTITCDQAANTGLVPGAPFAPVATIVVKTKLNLINGQIVTNTATIVEDPAPLGIVVPSTDSDSDTTVIRLAADLSINKIPALTAVTAGGASIPFASAGSGLPAGGLGDITYTLAVANAGPGDALNVAVLDNLPANTVLVSPPALDPATVTINGTPQPTFVMPCAGATQFSCVPGVNTAINPNFIAGVLPNHFAGIFRYRVRVPSSVAQATIIQNVASVNSSAPGDPTAQTPDPNAGNNVSLPTQVLVNASADVAIDKSTSNATPVAGGAAFSYTLTVTNAGPSDAQNVVVTDPLPQNVEFISVTPQAGSGFSCNGPTQFTNGTVTCNNPTMANGASATIDIVARANANIAPGVRTNTAVVTASTSDAATANNSDFVDQNIGTDADVTITKTGTPTSVVAGNNITYTINITNNGPSRARNVALTDTFPANTTFVSSNGTGILAGCSGGASLSCPTGEMESGESASLTVVLRVNPDAAAGVGALSNMANLAWTDTDADADTATVTFTSDVTRSTDLSISKDDSPDAITAGNDIIYTIKVKNNGPSTAALNAVTVTDATPANTTDVSVSGAGVFSGCNTPAALHGGCKNAGGPVQPGEEATITYRVKVNPNAPNGFITNIASVAAAEDGNNTNNEAVRQTAVGPSVDLAITKTSQTILINGLPLGQVVAGGNSTATGILGTANIEYVLTYRNNGPSDALNVHVRDVRPANSGFVLGSLAVNNIAGPALTCQIIPFGVTQQLDCVPNGGGTLPTGANGTITFRVEVPADVADNTVIKNQAAINSEANGATPATPDPNGGNNASIETQNTVRARADVTVAKTDTPDPVVAGQNVTYTLTVRNLTTSTTPANALTGSNAQNAVVTDALPAGVTFVSASSSAAGWVCTNANNTVTCNKAVFNAGAQETITIIGKVNSNVANGSSLSNTATIGASTDEPGGILNVGPNSSTVTTAVVTDAAVAITKADQPDFVIAGNNITYTMTVTNNGPSDAIDLRLSDPLPANVSFVSFNGTGIFGAAGACNQAGNTVTCGQPTGPSLTLPAGASANLTIVGKVASSVPALTILSNTATVTWQDSNAAIGATALNTTNAVTTTTVRHQSDLSLKKEAPEEVIAGQRMDYTLTLKNLGANDVLGGVNPGTVTVEDTLPAGVMAIEPMTAPNTIVSGPGGFTCTYTMATNKVVCVNGGGRAGQRASRFNSHDRLQGQDRSGPERRRKPEQLRPHHRADRFERSPGGGGDRS